MVGVITSKRPLKIEMEFGRVRDSAYGKITGKPKLSGYKDYEEDRENSKKKNPGNYDKGLIEILEKELNLVNELLVPYRKSPDKGILEDSKYVSAINKINQILESLPIGIAMPYSIIRNNYLTEAREIGEKEIEKPKKRHYISGKKKDDSVEKLKKKIETMVDSPKQPKKRIGVRELTSPPRQPYNKSVVKTPERIDIEYIEDNPIILER